MKTVKEKLVKCATKVARLYWFSINLYTKLAVSESLISLEGVTSGSALNINMKLGTLVHHVHGYKTELQIYIFSSRTEIWSFRVEKKKRGKIITQL